MKIHPTLLIGLGGSGKAVLDKIQRKLQERNVEAVDPAPLQYLAIDTDTREDPTNLDRFAELLNISAGDLAMIHEQNQYVRDFWPKAGYRASGHTTDGASAVRLRGRVCFFENIGEIVEKIENKKRELERYARLSDIDLAHIGGIKVIIISSTCGGTGSSSLLDLALLCRSKKLDIFDINTNITGILFLPDCFEGKVAANLISRVYANAYACLQELEYASDPANAGRLRIDYSDKYRDIWTDQRPFTECYLVSIHDDQGGIVANSPDDLFNLIAIDVADRLTFYENDYQAIFSNARDVLEQADRGSGKPRVFGAFGTQAIVYPKKDAKSYWRSRLQAEVLDLILKRTSAAPDQIHDSVQKFIQVNATIQEKGADQVIEFLSNSRAFQSARRCPDLDFFSEFKSDIVTREIQAFEKLVAGNLRQIEAILKDKSEKKVRDTVSKLNAHLSGFLVWGKKDAGGLAHAQEFLDTLETQLKVHDMDINDEFMKLGQDKTSLDNEKESDQQQVAVAKRASILWRRFRLKDAVASWVETQSDYLENEVELRLRTAVRSVYERIGRATSAMRTSLKKFESHLKLMKGAYCRERESTEKVLSKLHEGRFHEISLYSLKDLETLYTDSHIDSLAVARQTCASASYVAAALHPSEKVQAFHSAFSADVESCFTQLYGYDLITLGTEGLKWTNKVMRRSINRVAKRSVPFCEFKQEVAPKDPGVIFLVGIPGGDGNKEWIEYLNELKHIGKNVEVGYSDSTGSGDRNRISISYNVLGYPLFAYKQLIRRASQCYHLEMEVKEDDFEHFRPLHILPGAEGFPSIERLDQDVYVKFALGLAFGKIYQKSDAKASQKTFLWHTGNALSGHFRAYQKARRRGVKWEKPYSLQRGRRKAFENFCLLQDAQRDIEESIEELKKKKSWDEMSRSLFIYIQETLIPLAEKAETLNPLIQREIIAIEHFIVIELDQDLKALSASLGID